MRQDRHTPGSEDVTDARVDISIIVPTLNEGQLVADAVMRAWALEPREVLVVDGGSRDETVARAAGGGAVVLDSPIGRAAQQNTGARYATGEVLLFLHADTWLEPTAAGQMARALSDPQVVCGGFRQSIEADGRLYRALEWGNAWRARRGLPYGDQGLFVRRQAFQEVGGFPDVPIMEDLLLMRRLRRQTRPQLLPGPIHVNPRRWQRHGVVRQTARNWSLLAAERMGVSPEHLARWYRPCAAPRSLAPTAESSLGK